MTPIYVTKTCVQCGRPIKKNPKYSIAQWAAVRFCSRTCAHPRTVATYKCAHCGVAFERRAARVAGSRTFCSKQCTDASKSAPRCIERGSKWYCKKTGRWFVTWRNEHGRAISLLHSRWVWIVENGLIPKGLDVHHRDFDKTNDDIENLCLLTKAQHIHEHRKHIYKTTGDELQRRCSTCLEFKDASQFVCRKTGSGAGYFLSSCKPCQNAKWRAWKSASIVNEIHAGEA